MTGESHKPGQSLPPGIPSRPGTPSLTVAILVGLILAVVPLITRDEVWVLLPAAWVWAYCLWFMRRLTAIRVALADWESQRLESRADQVVPKDLDDD
jgi:hypothetical protein